MINIIPIVGWLLAFVFCTSLAVPFWIVWTTCEIGKYYFYFLPDVYLHPGFWDCVGFFMVVSILKAVLTPRFSSISNTNENKKDK